MELPFIFVARQSLDDATQPQRTYRNFMLTFAGAGLGLAALGIYSVLAYSVARHTREIGIRMAVGAERRHVLELVMAQGVRLIAIGAAIGLFASYWLTRLLTSQLFEVSPTDPFVFSVAACTLAATALLACWLPARRAAKVDPVEALRSE